MLTDMKQRFVLRSVPIALFATLVPGATASGSTDQGFHSLTGSPEPEVGSSSAASCDGLSDYGDAMLKIGRRWIKGMQRDGLADRSTRTFTAAEWEDYADRADRLLSDLRTVEPPAFAAPWHEAMVASARLKVNFGRSASLVGFDFTADLLATRVAATSDQLADARQEAAATCSDFTTFFQKWDGLDGQTATTAETAED
jgi:hypothetical protein